eukprot:TRINITY_DN12598_c0_g2_i2.p1 TRINITY_DN12598_c0_g2~~TRINITY_DN12598_c0_g2_i2.p1  ORF type:complete len:434 (-),score=136.11 TRINITY_DN12598_c0_g2_i2:179-1480(-)
MCWPEGRLNEVVFGLAEGKVRMGYIKKQYKSESLYGTSSYVVALASSPSGQFIVSGHLDHSIIRMDIEKKEKIQIVQHTSIPYALDWGRHIMAAGNDQLLVFYDENGSVVQRFDYATDSSVKEFTMASFNPSGETVVVGNFNKFFMFTYNYLRAQWEETIINRIENYYSISSLAWKKDGSKLVTGNLCGSVDIFDICMKVSRYKGKFEIKHVSPSQVIVKKLDTGESAVMKSTSSEISRIRIHSDRFVVAQTGESVLLCDIVSGKASEVPWKGSGNEKYDFSNAGVCMIYNAGELSIIEYGRSEVKGMCRIEYMSPFLISVRVSYTAEEKAKYVIAYLFDEQTMRIQDIDTNTILATIDHDAKIDYLTLNHKGTKLLFRDKQKQAHLFDINKQTKTTLVSYCSYVNWALNTDVVVAQNKNLLCIWYSIEQPEK